MANVLVEETSLTNIANAIRNKNGTAAKYKPSEMASAISQITTSEDLTSELTEQNTLITTQETTIDDIVSALQGKSAGSGGDAELEASFLSSIDGTLGANVTKLPNGITAIGNYAFYGNSNFAMTSLPDSITSIGNYAFHSCGKLALSKYPNNLVSIGEYAFYSCGKLTTNMFPNKLSTIGKWAFFSCPMTELNFPSTITSIGEYSFWQCRSLSKVIVNATTPPALGTNAFGNTPIAGSSGYIYVPDASVDAYKSATNWSTYANQIKGVSEL